MKLYCIFSEEAIKAMGGNRGKMAAQAGHAFLHSYWDAERHFSDRVLAHAYHYRMSGLAKKVTLVVQTTNELKELYEFYNGVCGRSLVLDSGLTVFKEPTITCLGLGPIPDDVVCENVKKLKVLI